MARGGGGFGGGGFGGGRGGGFGGSFGGSRSGGFGGNLGTSRGGGRPFPGSHGPTTGRPGYSPRPRMGFPFPMAGPVIINKQGTPGQKQYSNGPSSGGNGNQAPPPSNKGCGTGLLIGIIGIIILSLIAFFLFGGNGQIESSSVQREPLSSGSVNETDYITDEARWINNEAQAEEGLRYFYNQTGVQPHLLITNDISGSSTASPSEIEAYAEDFYNENFTDEAHLLLIFYEPRPNDYLTYYLAGRQAESVIDDEAGQILLDYLDQNYTNSSLDEEGYFSKSFKQAADRIMAVTKSPLPTILISLVVLIVAILIYLAWRRKQQAEKERQRQTEEMLSRPLETFGSQDLSDLEKKYQDSSEDSTQ